MKDACVKSMLAGRQAVCHEYKLYSEYELLTRQTRKKLHSARKSGGRIPICSKYRKWDLLRGVTMSSSD